MFGGPIFSEDTNLLASIEKKEEDVSFVILSDVWLDQPIVLEKLKTLFQGYSEAITPLMFIFIGNFQSAPFTQSSTQSKAYKGFLILM